MLPTTTLVQRFVTTVLILGFIAGFLGALPQLLSTRMWATFVQDGCILAVVFIVAFIIPHYYDSASHNRHQRRQRRKHAIPTASEERECATHPVHQVAHSASVSPARHAGGPRRVGSKEIRSRDIRRAPEAHPILNKRPSPQTKPKSRGSVDRYDDPGVPPPRSERLNEVKRPWFNIYNTHITPSSPTTHTVPFRRVSAPLTSYSNWRHPESVSSYCNWLSKTTTGLPSLCKKHESETSSYCTPTGRHHGAVWDSADYAPRFCSVPTRPSPPSFTSSNSEPSSFVQSSYPQNAPIISQYFDTTALTSRGLPSYNGPQYQLSFPEVQVFSIPQVLPVPPAYGYPSSAALEDARIEDDFNNQNTQSVSSTPYFFADSVLPNSNVHEPPSWPEDVVMGDDASVEPPFVIPYSADYCDVVMDDAPSTIPAALSVPSSAPYSAGGPPEICMDEDAMDEETSTAPGHGMRNLDSIEHHSSRHFTGVDLNASMAVASEEAMFLPSISYRAPTPILEEFRESTELDYGGPSNNVSPIPEYSIEKGSFDTTDLDGLLPMPQVDHTEEPEEHHRLPEEDIFGGPDDDLSDIGVDAEGPTNIAADTEAGEATEVEDEGDATEVEDNVENQYTPFHRQVTPALVQDGDETRSENVTTAPPTPELPPARRHRRDALADIILGEGSGAPNLPPRSASPTRDPRVRPKAIPLLRDEMDEDLADYEDTL